MNNLSAIAVLAALTIPVAPGAQQQAQDAVAQRPSLSARQLEASRALADMTRFVVDRPRPSLLAELTDRSIFLDTGVMMDPRVPQTTDTQLAAATCSADVVIVGTVQDLTPFLNEDGTFILTEYTVRVEDTLRGHLPAGSTISYVRAGGAMNINGRIVTARHNLFPPLLRGQKYVLFVKTIRQGSGMYKPVGGPLDALVGGKKYLGLGPRIAAQLTAGVEPDQVRQVVATTKCGG